MPETLNLAGEIEKQLPAELVDFMQLAGKVSRSRGQNLYLVGGVVRDLFLKRTNFDLDLVVEGDAAGLARELAGIRGGKIINHPRFGTANLRWGEWSVDMATARSETYARPGALPAVKPGSIKDDVFRRDFTVNAMAVVLSPDGYGQLLDFHTGRDDLERGLIRVLHERSFIDDATRIWRALRYEQRLDFRLEPDTLRLLRRDVTWLDTVSGDRIRHELELILKEERPEKTLRRAAGLKVLTRLHPSLKGNDRLAARFEQARRLSAPDLPPAELYLALLVYPLAGEKVEQLISYLRLRKSVAQVLRDTISLKRRAGSLGEPGIAPSRVSSLLRGYSATSITANGLSSDSPAARQRINLFLNKLRYVRPALTGEDLKGMSVAPGPRIREILDSLRNARLDGEVNSKQEETELVKRWTAGTQE